MSFPLWTVLVVLLVGASVGGGLGAGARWRDTNGLRTLFLYAILTASLAPIGAHYLWSCDRSERVIRQIEANIDADPEHYSMTDVENAQAALARFTWIAPVLLGGLYVLPFTTAGKRLWLRRLFPAVAAVSYVFAVTFLLYDPLGRYGYEAAFHLHDNGKMTVWTLVLCAGVQAGLFTYVWAAPNPSS